MTVEILEHSIILPAAAILLPRASFLPSDITLHPTLFRCDKYRIVACHVI
jgi:hypothetical protein